ncbi:DsbE family thiol:disulfide interchange protein [Lonepinella sp. BR2474]|uniref:DsbE family thiol:disulfide interchange protein n=1 Tax=Lonepinella sp. BR2474 TaxID=3434548 RepID=UPI003F6E16A2
MNKKILFFMPLLLILAICGLLFQGLQQDPKKIASALIGRPVPEFYQASIEDSQRVLSNKDLPQTPYLINVWGSWCYFCRLEHKHLLALAEKNIPIVGLNYRDKPQSAVEYLQKFGNPFVLNINDSQGKLAMQLGVDGAPETYVVDKHGIIRYRYSGAFDHDSLQNIILPELEKWK